VADAYADLIADEMKKDEADLDAFRSRALNVLSVAGGLVTLTSGLIALSVSADKNVLEGWAWLPLILALVAYLAASVMALSANLPTDVDRPGSDDLEELASDGWSDDELAASQSVAQVRVVYLRSLRALSTKVSRRLQLALGAEVVAIAMTGVTGLVVIRQLSR
jgi:hypothetical protein